MSLPTNLRHAVLLASIAGCLGMLAPNANATIYWDGTALGTGVGTGWDAVTSWSTDPVNPDVDPGAIPGATDIASFNISSVTSDQTVNMYANQSALGLNFASTGVVTIQGGDANHALALGTSGVTVSGNNGEVSVGSPTNTSGQRVSMTLSGSQTWTNNGTGGVLTMGNTSNGAIAPASGGGNITLTLDGTNTAISTLAPHLNNSNAVYGVITNGGGGEVLNVVKNGPGTWVLPNNSNSFSGGVTLNSGILAISASSGSTVGTGTLTLNGGELHPSGGFQSSLGLTNPVVVTGDVRIDPTRVDPTAASNMYFTGPWSSTGTPGNGPVVTIGQRTNGTQGTIGFKLGVDFSAFTGTIKPTQFPSVSGGTVISWYGTGAQSLNLSNAKFDVETATGNAIGINNDQIVGFNVVSVGNRIQLGELSGNGRIGSNAAVPSYLIEVGALNTNSVFSGDMVQRYSNTSGTAAGDASEFNLKKVGTGSLTMSGDNSYIGDTTIANGTLVAGIDALVSKANISLLRTGAMSITSNTFDNSASSPGTPHGLSDGDRVFVESFSNGFTDTNVLMNAQPFYVVGSTSTTFQLSLSPGGSPQAFADEPFGGAAVAMPTAFGAGITPIALGDGTGGAVKLLAGTATKPTVTIARDVTVAGGGGVPTFGSEVNGNSAYSGAISLGQNTSLTSASVGANALTVSGAISSTGAFGLTKVGAGNAILSGTNTYSGTTTVSQGTLLINGNNSAATGAVTIASLATLGGTGTIGGAVTNNGTIAPGASVGILSVAANFADGANSIWAIELLGAAADKLAVTGNIDLTAVDSLVVTGIGTGTSWIIGTYTGTESGAFNSITSGYAVTYTGGNITLNTAPACAPGDLNCDGHVNAQDYVFWRKTNGPAGDYTAWRQNFGSPPGSGSGLGDSAGNVPEPASLLLMVTAVVGAFASRRRR